MKLPIKRIHPKAKMPQFETEQAACFDLVATERERHGNTATYGTGLVMDIPEGYHLKIYSRSGHGFKHGLRLANSTGIIDSDYLVFFVFCLVKEFAFRTKGWACD